jgi:hypothetical protein
LHYAFDDWGATLGKWGGFFSRDKWNADGFSRQTRGFVLSPDGKTLQWGYRGKHWKDVTSGITVDDVRWLLVYLSRVTDAQLRAGFQASGAKSPEIDLYVGSLRERITQLQRVSGSMIASR